MADSPIICKPTADTFVRFAVVLAAFFGFGLYFFYDGAIGYRVENEVFCSYHAFAELGGNVDSMSEEEWHHQVAEKPLLTTERQGGEVMFVTGAEKPVALPLPKHSEAIAACPAEAADYAAMKQGWMECWQKYTERKHFPIKPGEHGHDMGAIREQWIAGGVCMLISAALAFLMFRTSRRVMSLHEDVVNAAGETFTVADITRLDLRQWGKGFKGVAYATVKGRKIRMDGMTYGGFSQEKGEPAEQFMKALLAQYKGEVIEYASTDDK